MHLQICLIFYKNGQPIHGKKINTFFIGKDGAITSFITSTLEKSKFSNQQFSEVMLRQQVISKHQLCVFGRASR